MDKINHPYLSILEKLHALDQSIYILNSVNNDLQQILHKQKPLPKFICDSFKRPITNKSKTNSANYALPPPLPPTESEEIRLALNMIDKAKRTIESVGEKKPKQSSNTAAATTTVLPIQVNSAQHNRPKTSSSIRPSSASSTTRPPLEQSSSQAQKQQQQPVRRYTPAHMKAPFLTQPEKKRRPSSATRTNSRTISNKKPGAVVRSSSQQRRPSTSLTTQSIVEVSQQTVTTVSIPTVENENFSVIDNKITNEVNNEMIALEQQPDIETAEESTINSNEINEIDILPVTQPTILNRASIKPLLRLWKQNQNLRLRLELEFNKKSNTSSIPLFINRLNEKMCSSATTQDVCIPNIEVLLQLAMKIRTIVLYLLEKSTFDNLEDALKRLNTLKSLINQYHHFFHANVNILVATHAGRPSNINTNIEEWLKKPMSCSSKRNIVRYTDDSQLIAFAEVRFKQFENECRWIELNLHEQMIKQFKQSLSNKNQNPLQIYRELMSLVTGLQTSTPIVVENKYE